jgi:ankyrin repeat protein
MAASSGHSAVVSCLLEQGAEVGKSNQALYAAISHQHVDIARQLLKAGMNPNQQNDPDIYRATSTLSRAIQTGNDDMITLLIEAKAEVEPTSGTSPINAAISMGRMSLVRKLIDAKAVLNDSRCIQLLQQAINGNKPIEMIEQLIALAGGVNVNVSYSSRNMGEQSLAFWAASKGHLNILKQIDNYPHVVVNKLEVAKDWHKAHNLLHIATMHEQPAIVQDILDSKVDIAYINTVAGGSSFNGES